MLLSLHDLLATSGLDPTTDAPLPDRYQGAALYETASLALVRLLCKLYEAQRFTLLPPRWPETAHAQLLLAAYLWRTLSAEFPSVHLATWFGGMTSSQLLGTASLFYTHYLPTLQAAPVHCYLFAFIDMNDPFHIHHYDITSDPHPTSIHTLPIRILETKAFPTFEEARADLLTTLSTHPVFHSVLLDSAYMS